MKFAIRDDDTNFFTKPEELENAFNKLWSKCPISLAIVPFHACTKTNQIPQKYWSGNKVFPIDKNNDLIKLLKQKLKEEKIDILLHGYNHKIEPDGFEFELIKDPYEKIIEGKNYLEELFDVKISVFVPPNNSISNKSVKALRRIGLNISGIPSVQFPHVAWWQEAFFEYLFNHVSPYKIHCFKNKELYYHYLTPKNIQNVLSELYFSKKFNGSFCLATHYWELKNDYKSTFNKFMNVVLKDKNVKFYKLSKLF